MRRGFTLLELIIVIIIIGVLATLGFTQYGKMIEKARGAEAKSILGDIRKFAAAHYLEFGALDVAPVFDDSRANIGTAMDNIPSVCHTAHYFSYAITPATAAVTITATRCAASGKTPNSTTGGTIILTVDLATGVDSWVTTGGY